jgi:hypothetical protein
VAPAAGVGLLLAAMTVLLLRARPDWRARTGGSVAGLLPILWRVAAVGVVALALYAYFLRPVVTETRLFNYWYGGDQIPALDQENFIRLGWYLSPLGLALGVGGIALMLLREANRRTAFLLVAGGFFALMFLWRIGANPHQIYAMRRYVPQVLPFFTVAGVYLVWSLWNKLGPRGRIPVALLTLGWIVGIFVCGQPFTMQVDYRGLATQISELSRAFPEKSVVLFSDTSPVGIGDFVGTPLRFLEDKRVFVVRDPAGLDPIRLENAVRHWQEQGYTVYWAATENAMQWPDTALEREQSQAYTIETEMLEGTFDRKPSAVLPGVWRLAIAKILPDAQSQSYED